MKGVIMLVLSRKIGERVCIGQNVLLTIVVLKNGQVRLGFETPEDVAIDREEIRQRLSQSIAKATPDERPC